jgi:hypothetical protein
MRDQFTSRVIMPSLECPCRPPPYKVSWWARGWWIVGDGPSYLLFRAEERRVTHLVAKAIPHYLRESLHRFSAIENDKLVPLVRALIRLHAANADDLDCRLASEAVAGEIERLIYLPDQALFDAQLGRFASLVRAARRLQLYHGSEFHRSWNRERSIFTLSDSHGNEVLMSDAGTQPRRVFRCVPHSRVAACATKLLAEEQESFVDQFRSLYCVPTRKELRLHLCRSDPDITKMCQTEGFDWLPRATRQA